MSGESVAVVVEVLNVTVTPEVVTVEANVTEPAEPVLIVADLQNQITITAGLQGPAGIPGANGDASPQAAETDSDVEVGQPLYLKPNGHVDLAQADNALRSQVCGLAVSNATATIGVNYVSEGVVERSEWSAITGTALLTPGVIYYLSLTAGRLTSNPASTGFLAPIGRALTPTKLDVEIHPTIKL